MQATTTIGLLAATLLTGAAPTAHAQIRTGETGISYEQIVWSNLMHLNAKEGIIEVALAKDLPKNVTRSDRRALNRIVRDLKAGSTKGADMRWSRFAADYAKRVAAAEKRRPRATDTNQLIQWVLRKSYVETNKDLKFSADKVKFYNDAKTEIREHLAKMKEMRSGMSADARVYVRKLRLGPNDANGKGPVTSRRPTWMSRDELDSYIEHWDEELQTIGEDAQLANVDMQNMLQKQQQALQMLSNMSKMLHDTALSIIRKLSG